MPSGVVAAASVITGVFNQLLAELGGAGNLIGFGVNTGQINPNVFSTFECATMTTNTSLGASFFFGLLPTNIPDTDASWISLDITGVFDGGGSRTITYVRSNRSTYNSNVNSQTRWDFANIPNNDRFVDGNAYDLEFIF